MCRKPIYKSTFAGNSWATWATLSGGGILAAIFDAMGDVLVASAADIAARLAAGAKGRVLMADSAQASGLKWAGGLYMSRRLLATVPNANETIVVNLATYIGAAALQFCHDWDIFPATHYLITSFGQSNEAGHTLTFQLATNADPTNPVSAAGDDLVMTNSLGVSSGWETVSDAMSGLTHMVVAVKGSNASVDFSGRWIDIVFRIE